MRKIHIVVTFGTCKKPHIKNFLLHKKNIKKLFKQDNL